MRKVCICLGMYASEPGRKIDPMFARLKVGSYEIEENRLVVWEPIEIEFTGNKFF